MRLALLLLLLLAPAFASAGNHLVSPEFVDVTTGNGYVCVILKGAATGEKNSLECWGNLQWEMTQPIKSIENPESFAPGVGKFCVLGGGEMECATWMANEKFSGVKMAAGAARDYFCFVDAEGLKCRVTLHNRTKDPFKGDLVSPLPGVKNPQQLAVGYGMGCVLDAGVVRCWEHDSISSKVAAVPELRNPRQIAASASHICALEDRGVVCWGLDFQQKVWTALPPLEQAHSLALAGGQLCLIEGGQLKCWQGGGFNGDIRYAPLTTNQPDLKNVRLFHNSGHACAVDDDGLHCWSANKKYLAENFMPLRKLGLPSAADPEFNLDQLPRFLHTAGEMLSPARRLFFLTLAKVSLAEFPTPDRSAKASYGRLLLARIAHAVVLASDSQVAQGKLKQALENSLRDFAQELQGMQPALTHQPRASLSALHLALVAMKDFLSPAESAELSGLIRNIGQAMASPNQEAVRAVLSELQAQEALIQKLKLNPRASFLVAALREATSQLEGK